MSGVLTPNRSRIVTREQLARIPTPIATSTFRPVAHAELVDMLTRRLQERGVQIAKQEYAVSANDQQIFGKLDFVTGIEMPGLGRAMGFHAANDKSLAINIVAGVRVVVCDNLNAHTTGAFCEHVP